MDATVALLASTIVVVTLQFVAAAFSFFTSVLTLTVAEARGGRGRRDKRAIPRHMKRIGEDEVHVPVDPPKNNQSPPRGRFERSRCCRLLRR